VDEIVNSVEWYLDMNLKGLEEELSAKKAG